VKGAFRRKQRLSLKSGACATNRSCWRIGKEASTLSQWNEFQEQTKMIKLTEARYLGNFQISVSFSDGKEGVFDGNVLLQNSGSLLEPLRDGHYFQRFFVDAGALCWPNGLELSPARLHEASRAVETA
jgi:hypothetical protein